MLVLLITFSIFVFAVNCPPSIPKTYYGTVSFDEELLDGSFEIRVVMGSDTIGISDVSDGEYEMDISPCSGTTGSVIFYINGIEANKGGSYNGVEDWGISENLDLTLDEMPPESITCGDEDIQSGEECDGENLAGRSVDDCGTGWTGTISCSSTCEIDYSNCVFGTSPIDDDDDTPTDNSGGSSGGGGGGSGSSSSTTSVSSKDGLTTITAIEDFSTEDETIGLGENQEQTSSGMTGAVINFVTSGSGIGFIITSLLLIVGIWVVKLRKKLKNKIEEKVEEKVEEKEKE